MKLKHTLIEKQIHTGALYSTIATEDILSGKISQAAFQKLLFKRILIKFRAYSSRNERILSSLSLRHLKEKNKQLLLFEFIPKLFADCPNKITS